MPSLEEMSVSSDSGSDMDLESANSESHQPTAIRTSEERLQIEQDIFGDSESSSEELYMGPHQLERATRSWVLDSEMSSDSEDRIIDDWDRIPVQEDEPEDQMDETVSIHSKDSDESMDSSILKAITQDAYNAVLHSVSVFLETESAMIDVSQCKFKNGRSPKL